MTTALEQEMQERNPWEAQAARFEYAATKLNLDKGLWKILSQPNRETTSATTESSGTSTC